MAKPKTHPAKAKEELHNITKIGEAKIEDKTERKQFLVFQLDEEDYAIDILQANEILKMVPITRIPSTPDFVRGVINLRGKIVVVVDAEKKIKLKPREETPDTRIIIAELEEKQIGIVVDSVSEVIWIPVADIKGTPKTLEKKVELDYIKGVAIVGERLVIVLNLEKLLNEDEMKDIVEIQKSY